MISSSSGGLAAIVADRFITGELSLGTVTNGLLAGAVAVCAGADVYEPWACLFVGGVGGLACMAWFYVLPMLRIDDAVSVSGQRRERGGGKPPLAAGCGYPWARLLCLTLPVCCGRRLLSMLGRGCGVSLRAPSSARRRASSMSTPRRPSGSWAGRCWAR
jgi:hypothetical protein